MSLRTPWADLTFSYFFFLTHRKGRWTWSVKSGYSANYEFIMPILMYAHSYAHSLCSLIMSEQYDRVAKYCMEIKCSNTHSTGMRVLTSEYQMRLHVSYFILYHSFTISLYASFHPSHPSPFSILVMVGVIARLTLYQPSLSADDFVAECSLTIVPQNH